MLIGVQRNLTFSFVGFEILRDFWKEQEEGNYWCTRFATSQRQAGLNKEKGKFQFQWNSIPKEFKLCRKRAAGVNFVCQGLK